MFNYQGLTKQQIIDCLAAQGVTAETHPDLQIFQ